MTNKEKAIRFLETIEEDMLMGRLGNNNKRCCFCSPVCHDFQWFHVYGCALAKFLKKSTITLVCEMCKEREVKYIVELGSTICNVCSSLDCFRFYTKTK